MTLISFISSILASGVLAAQIFIGLIIIYLFFFQKKYPSFKRLLTRYGFILAFATASLATLGSLFYSEIAGFTPCSLCWYQRIFMYPQALLLGIAFFKKDKNITDYCLAMCGVGTLIAIYHYFLQLGILPGSCTAIGYSASCAKLYILNFGYLTIPVMSMSAFLLIATFLLFSKIKHE